MCGWQHLNLLHVHAACVRMPSDCCGISLVHSLDHNLPCVTSEGKFQRLKSLVSQWSHHVTSMFPGKYVEDVEGCYSPHLCVGFLFLILYPGFFPASPPPPPPPPPLHTPSFTHHFVTHHLSHTSSSHTIFHTHLCHIPSFTHHFVMWHL